MNNAIPDDVKHLVGDEMMDTVPQGDDDLDYESFVKEYSPEAICQGEDQNGDDEGANDPLARKVPTDDEFDPPTAEFAGYLPTHHELLQLARYWVRESLDFRVYGILFGFSDGHKSWLAALGGVRLRRIARLIGADEVQRIVEQVEEQYHWSLGDRVWEIFTRGTDAELRAFREEFVESWPYPASLPSAIPHGVFPVDIGLSECFPKAWQEFRAFCKAAGLRQKLTDQVRALWREFMGRREEAGEP